MALLFMDGFDHYITADILKKWTTNGSNTIEASSGRRSSAALKLNGSNVITKALGVSATTVIVGAAFNLSSFTNNFIIALRNNTTDHVRLFLNTGGTLSVQRDTTTLGTSSSTLSLSSYYYIELKATIHDTTGSYELRVNGTNWLSATNVDTRNGATTQVNTVALFGSSGGTHYVDDLYICDDTGSAPNNSFLGDCRVDTLFPNADGTYTSFTPSTGTDHYALVDETAPNTSDYVESSTAGHQDSYQMGNLSTITGTIYGVQASAAVLKDDAGARSLKVGVRSSTTDSLSAAQALSTSQLYYAKIQETDPATGVAWTESGVNAAQLMVENV